MPLLFMSNNFGRLWYIVATNPSRSSHRFFMRVLTIERYWFFYGSSNHFAIRLVVSRMRDQNLRLHIFKLVLFTELGEVYI